MSKENELGGSYEINDAGEKVLVHRTGYVAPAATESEQTVQTVTNGKRKLSSGGAAAKDQQLDEVK